MGLSVSVYTNVKPCENEDFDFVAYVLADRWRHKVKNLEYDGSYIGVNHRIIDSSYSSHSRFREYLVSLFSLGGLQNEKGEIIWENLTEGMPFIDLIDFADSEGCLDWETASRLLNDFNKFSAKNADNLNHVMKERYESWHRAVKMAADEKGVIVFS